MGLRRHLTAAEIVEQAVFARRLLTSEVGSITNVVFMVGQIGIVQISTFFWDNKMLPLSFRPLNFV